MRLNRFSIYDETPLWSAPFGLTLLEQVKMRRDINVLDIGSGGGFPMLELAERFGSSCRIYGLDPSEDAMEMINEKIRTRGIRNAAIIKGVAEKIPFPDGCFGLVTANNGLNNVSDEKQSLAECFRVLSGKGQLVMTVNLPGTFQAFYDVFKEVLSSEEKIMSVDEHIFSKRKPVSWWEDLLTGSGFKVENIIEDSFSYRFSDAGAFLDHYFIKTAFSEPWKEIAGNEIVFEKVRKRLDEVYGENLKMDVPYVCFSCFRD